MVTLLSVDSCFGMEKEKEVGKIEETEKPIDDSDENNSFVFCTENEEEVPKYVGDPKLQMAFYKKQKELIQDVEDIFGEQD